MNLPESRNTSKHAHTSNAVGYNAARLGTEKGRAERIAELEALADWYAMRGDKETAADYRAQAQAIA